jgi:replicative DNA helicase
MDNILATLPPQSIDAEQWFLAACLRDNDIVKRCTARKDDFYKSNHGIVFSAMQSLSAKGEPIDTITITDEIGFGKVEGLSGLVAELSSPYTYPTAANWKSHEAIIKEKSTMRKVLRLLSEKLGTIESDGAEKTIHDLRIKLSSIQQRDSTGIVSLAELVGETASLIERRSQQEGLSGITSGYRDIDALTDGWQPGELIIVAGRPGMGKTVFGVGCAKGAAKAGHAVGMIHLEMGKSQLGMRSISGKSGIPLNNLRRGRVRDHEWDRISNACGELARLQVFLDFSATTDRAIAKTIDNMVFDKGCEIIVIDYIQLATTEDSTGRNREQEVSAISRMLKLKAKEHHIPVIALAQLNRQCELRQDKRPMTADLRESGALEQDADIIAFLYIDEKYNPATIDKGIAEVIFRKGRMIELDTVKLQWDGPTTTYRDLEGYRPDATADRY